MGAFVKVLTANTFDAVSDEWKPSVLPEFRYMALTK